MTWPAPYRSLLFTASGADLDNGQPRERFRRRHVADRSRAGTEHTLRRHGPYGAVWRTLPSPSFASRAFTIVFFSSADCDRAAQVVEVKTIDATTALWLADVRHSPTLTPTRDASCTCRR